MNAGSSRLHDHERRHGHPGHRLLTALAGEGLVDRDPTSGRWLLGPELYLLGASAATRNDVVDVVDVVLHDGIRFPLGVASAGLAKLAHLPDREIDHYFGRTDLTTAWGEKHSDSQVRKRIASTRRTGYAVNPALLVDGSWGMAAAVFDASDRPAWALSVTGVQTRFRPDRRRELGARLLAKAHQPGARVKDRR